jgi:HEAT repeat protein
MRRRIDPGIALGVLLALPMHALADEPVPMTPAAARTRAEPKPNARAAAPAATAPRPPAGPQPGLAPTQPSHAVPTGTLHRLASSDPASVAGAIDELRARGGAADQRALIARLEDGLPPALAQRAIDALVALKAARATDTLVALMQHRRAAVRLRALEGIAVLAPRGSPAAGGAAVVALQDPALEVRDAATRAVTRLRHTRAVPALLSAHDRGLLSAAAAIGALGGRSSLDPLLARVNDGVFEPIIPALDGFLLRADFPRDAKLALIEKLAKSGSPSAQRYLVGLAPRIRPVHDARLEQAVAKALERLSAPDETAPAVDPRASATKAGGR